MNSCLTGTSDYSAAELISTVHPDIIKTHIFTRLDGASLLSAACASSKLYSLSNEDNLWREICTAAWPSISDPRVTRAISTFPVGHRSFFSDSFPILDQHSSNPRLRSSTITPELISAVDIYYQGKLVIFSKVQETETATGWFLSSPFRVDLLEQEESVPTRIIHQGQNLARHLEENLTLSWILVDPTRNRAMNVSSRRPVSVQRNWFTGDTEVMFATIMGGDEGREPEIVECKVVVAWSGKEGGVVEVREVSMVVEDIEGRRLSGKESMEVLGGAMEGGKRKKEGKEEEEKQMYKGFVSRKRSHREKNKKKEEATDLACMVLGVTIFIAFLFFVLLR